MQTYDVIVIGTGGVGSAALYHLAKRGVKVLGLDRFPPGHDRGSSHGRTRIIRQAYFEHPDYVPLLKRAYELWEELSQECGKQLYHEIGLLQIGPPNGTVVPGVLKSARLHNLPVDHLTAEETRDRFPGFQVLDKWEAIFEPRAGYLDVEDCVLAHLDEAKKLGADVRSGVAAHKWSADDNGVIVTTDAGEFRASNLVVAAGAWAKSFLSELGIALEVRRKAVFWYSVRDLAMRADHGCPAYLFQLYSQSGSGIFYGIPEVDDWGFKIAEHTGGRILPNSDSVFRDIRPSDQAMVKKYLQFLPQVGPNLLHHSVCLYTMSPDENFIVDIHPQHPNVFFAAGLSGHGFKFTCVLGEILADLALEGKTSHPIGFLNCRRFGTV